MRVERFGWDGGDPAAMALRLRGLVPSPGEVTADVERILAEVRDRGDAAVAELAERFGEPSPMGLRVDPEAIAAAPGLLEPHARGRSVTSPSPRRASTRPAAGPPTRRRC
jgi:histidinol dehydrogenase